jgi:hypothetical protein
MYIYLDSKNRIIGWNPNDMTGNTGWYKTDEIIPVDIFTIDGIPFLKFVSGQVVKRTEAEIENDRAELEAAQPTEIEITDTDMLEFLADQEERLCMLELLSGEV